MRSLLLLAFSVTLLSAQSERVMCSKPSFAYPPLPRPARIEGDVSAQVTVDSEGRVTEVKAKGHPLLVPSVEKGLSGGRFADANGRAGLEVTVHFRLTSGPDGCPSSNKSQCWKDSETEFTVVAYYACLEGD